MDKLLDWDNDRIQRLLRVTDQKDLIIALIGASKEVQEKLFSNMPEGVRNHIKWGMEELSRPLWLRRLVGCIKLRDLRFAWTGLSHSKSWEGIAYQHTAQKFDAGTIQEVRDRIMYMADNLEAVESEIEQLNALEQNGG